MTFMSTGLHLRIIEILGESLHRAPPGTLAPHGDMVPYLIRSCGAHLSMGLQLAGPLIALIFIVNVLMALLARLAPRMNVFFAVGMTSTTVAGMVLVFASIPWFVAVHLESMRQAVGVAARILGLADG